MNAIQTDTVRAGYYLVEFTMAGGVDTGSVIQPGTSWRHAAGTIAGAYGHLTAVTATGYREFTVTDVAGRVRKYRHRDGNVFTASGPVALGALADSLIGYGYADGYELAARQAAQRNGLGDGGDYVETVVDDIACRLENDGWTVQRHRSPAGYVSYTVQ